MQFFEHGLLAQGCSLHGDEEVGVLPWAGVGVASGLVAEREAGGGLSLHGKVLYDYRMK